MLKLCSSDDVIFVPSFVKISQSVSELLSGHALHTEIYKGHNYVNTVNCTYICMLQC